MVFIDMKMITKTTKTSSPYVLHDKRKGTMIRIKISASKYKNRVGFGSRVCKNCHR